MQPVVSYYATIKGFPLLSFPFPLPSPPLWLMSGSSEGISAMQRTLHKSLSSLQRASGCMRQQQQQQQQQWHSTHAPSNMRHDIAESLFPPSPPSIPSESFKLALAKLRVNLIQLKRSVRKTL